jgi:hypothetical protein
VSGAPGRRRATAAVLVQVRTGRHEGFDRVVFGGGRVRFGIGLAAVAGYKVSELPPDRTYVDVAA